MFCFERCFESFFVICDMHNDNLNLVLQHILNELSSGIKLPLDSMVVVNHVEDMLKEESNFMALVSFHMLKLIVRNYDHF